MTWLSYSAAEVHEQVLELLRSKTGLASLSPVGRLRGIGEASSTLLQRLYESFLVPVSKQIDWRTAKGIWLQLLAIQAGVEPMGASPARGNATLTVTGGASGTIAATATISAGGQGFRVLSETAISDGALVPIEAVDAGPAGNVSPQTAAMTPAVAGVAVALDDNWLDYPGQLAEGDEPLRERIRATLEAVSVGWPPPAFRSVALRHCPLASVLRTPRGAGSATVVVARRGAAATPAQLAAVEAGIAPSRDLCRDVLVMSAALVPVPVSVDFQGTAVAADVEAAIESWGRSNIEIGESLVLSGLWGLSITGVSGLSVTAPADTVPATPTQLLVLQATATAV